jgi:hypothetical protein
MYNHKRIQPRHNEIIRRAFLGQTQAQIAAELGFSPQTICLLLNSTLAKIALERMRQASEDKCIDAPARVRLASELRELQDESVKTQLEIIKNPVADIKVKAAIAKQHVSEGVYETEEKKEEKISFRDLMRALDNSVQQPINITPSRKELSA